MESGKLNIVERFRPKTLKDMVGNSAALDHIKANILKGRTSLVHGKAGIGKTTAVIATSRDLGYTLIEVNSSDERKKADMKSFLRQVSTPSFYPTVFLLDEVDGAEDFSIIEKCVKLSANSLVLVCNDLYALPKDLVKLCDEIKFYDPTISEVIEVVKKIASATGMTPDFSRVSRDIRNSILSCFYGGDGYDNRSDFDTVDKFFSKLDISELTSDHFVWLLDNGAERLHGRNLFEFLQMLEVADTTGRFEPLKVITQSRGKVEFPRYLQRMKVLRSNGRKDAQKNVG